MNNINNLKGKNIVIGVTGGIAAYKAVSLVSDLRKEEANVQVLMTEDAKEFVDPTTFKGVSGNPVLSDLYREDSGRVEHIELSRSADLFALVPATYNTIGKISSGIADNLLTAAIAATEEPVLFCPSMDFQMFENTANQSNLQTLIDRGYYVMEPEEGKLASGRSGKGRLPEPEKIREKIESILKQRNILSGKKVLVTAGPTREPLDPIRYISNKSSGKMGYALAEEGRRCGGEVLLISGPTELNPPKGVGFIRIDTGKELEEVVLEEYQKYDLIFMAAAVSDWRPSEEKSEKMKKEKTEELDLQLTKTTDILKKLGKLKKEGQVLVGFAAETEDMMSNAAEKLEEKNLNAVFANPAGEEGIGPGADLNRGTLLFKSLSSVEFKPQSKTQLARGIVREVATRFYGD